MCSDASSASPSTDASQSLRLYISSRAHVTTLARSLDFKPRFAVLAYTDLTLRFTERCTSADCM